MRKRFKEISRATGLHYLAAEIQNQRRALLRRLGLGTKHFKLSATISFPIDIAARKPFEMFTGKDPEMHQEITQFSRLVAGKACFLDIGGLYGIFSLAFTTINPDGEAHVIEPSPKCLEILTLNRDLNPEKSIQLNALAFGAEVGRLAMHYEWVHLIANHEERTRGRQVAMTSLDEFVKSHDIYPDVIKLDVDGYEGPVIEGALHYLANHDPIIFLELHGHWIERYGYTPNEIRHALEKFNYRFYDLDLKPITDPERAFNRFANRIICLKPSHNISP